jgi:arylsulfatase
MDNWGRPTPLILLASYLKEWNFLVSSLPISYMFIIMVLIIPSVPIFILIYKRAKLVNRELENMARGIKTFFGYYRFIFLFLLILFSILFLTNDRLVNKISESPRTRWDPFLSLIFYKIQRIEVTDLGLDKLKSKEQYPNKQIFNKKNVILITCDALRPDHFGFNGYHRETTPFLDSLFYLPNSYYLDHFYATCSRSFIAISNILSSQYGISVNNFFIHDLLSKQGYKNHFILSGDHTYFFGLKKHYGENIDMYHDGFIAKKESKNKISFNDDRAVILSKLADLEPNKSQAAFFYFHFMSTHQNGIIDSTFIRYTPNKIDYFSSQVHEALVNDYDNRLIQLDQYLNECISILGAKGYMENSILIITADHGQALMEKNRYWHGKSVYKSETSVPFILHINGAGHKTKSVLTPYANQLDIIPTITDILGIPQPDCWQGKSVFQKDNRPTIFQQERDQYAAIWEEKGKILQFIYNKRDKTKELINLTDHESKKFNYLNAGFDLDSIQNKLANFFKLDIQ